MNLEFRGEVQCGNANIGILVYTCFFQAKRLDEITQRVKTRKKQRSLRTLPWGTHSSVYRLGRWGGIDKI